MNYCVRTVLAAVVAGSVASCGSNTPTAPTQAAAGAAATTFSLSGRVVDNAGVSIPGALVTVVGGMESSLTDGSGRYQLRGLPGGVLAVRASKDGYVASTSNIELPRNYPADFVLTFTGPSFDLAGDYTVTFTADAACVQLPEVVRSRTYRASIAPPYLPNDYYVTLSGARFHDEGAFVASVSGRSASFSTEPDGSGVVVHERLGESASIWIDFVARVDAVDASTVSVPMFATYQFCADDNGGGVFSCRVSRITCTSSNHRFTLTRH